MFKIYRDGDSFTLKAKTKTINKINIFTLTAVMRQLGISNEEITSGLNEMLKKDDNVIDYGVFGNWTYTDKLVS